MEFVDSKNDVVEDSHGRRRGGRSLRNRFYYLVKPLIPRDLRMGIRSWYTKRIRQQAGATWPIMPGSERLPEGWTGWPDGKQFAIVLTHDVEGSDGRDKCRDLMHLELECGFRSSFNFIPEGTYETPFELRRELIQNGFEVGIHDLKHDGHLFSSRAAFRTRAGKINEYARDWGAVGFRAGFMLHELDWFHDLDIKYDLSTFDTDPFEPQPEGRHTIFPFWVPRPANGNPPGSFGNGARDGYVEMPYTLTQDSTVFLLLKEETPDIWLRKLEWIACHGGMALVNIHPDYIDFSSDSATSGLYSAAILIEFLSNVRDKFHGRYWNPLPRELADWYGKLNLPCEAVAHAASAATTSSELSTAHSDATPLKGKRAAVLLYSDYPGDPRPRRAAEALVAAGMEVDLLCLRDDPSEPKRERSGGVNIFRHPFQRKRGGIATYLLQYGGFIFSGFWFLLKRSFGRRFDLVHVHNMPDVLVFAALVPKLLGARVILDLHDPMPELMSSIYELKPTHPIVRLLKILERWSIGFANLAITPNVTFKKLFVTRSCSGEKMQIVMNSPEEAIFNPDSIATEAAPVSADGEFRIMHHGSILHRHGLDLLVEAVARIRPEIPGVRLEIFGSRTPFLATVLETAERCGVADIVHYHGSKSQTEIAAAIRDSHLGVVPNRRSAFTELNFPTRIFEYLSMHRPVIAPNTQGIRDYFEPDQLFMFAPDDVQDLAQRILWVRNNPSEVQSVVERGLQVYREHLWSGEKKRFVNQVVELVC